MEPGGKKVSTNDSIPEKTYNTPYSDYDITTGNFKKESKDVQTRVGVTNRAVNKGGMSTAHKNMKIF